jgi:uncharacterized membrane protein
VNSPISDADIALIEDAVRAAERRTSGEVRVHIEAACPPERAPLARAVEVFEQLGMTATARRNGVLFYVALHTRNFAVVGDAGIDAVVPPGFWDAVRDRVLADFRQEQYAAGLAAGLALAGEQLARYFPFEAGTDANELPDTVSRG